MRRTAHTRKQRRKNRAVLKHGAAAAPIHKAPWGRTGKRTIGGGNGVRK